MEKMGKKELEAATAVLIDKALAKDKAKGVDGVIVGSAFVKILLDDSISDSQKIVKISALAREIKDKIN